MLWSAVKRLQVSVQVQCNVFEVCGVQCIVFKFVECSATCFVDVFKFVECSATCFVECSRPSHCGESLELLLCLFFEVQEA